MLITSTAFGNQALNDLKSNESISFDVEESGRISNRELNQKLIIGHGGYKCYLFCPLFKVGETNFSFLAKASDLEVETLKIPNRDNNFLVKNQGFIYKYTYTMESESSKIL